MPIGLALAAVSVSLVSITGASAATSSGIRGTVIESPISPVCREGVPCSGPAAGIVLVASLGGIRVATATTNDAGVYRFVLRPGTYVVCGLRTSMFGSVPARTVRVVKGRFLVVNYEIDTGIR